MEARTVIGLMSGTSLDGVDAVFARFFPDFKFEIIDEVFIPYEESFKKRIFDVIEEKSGLRELCQLNFDISEKFAYACNYLISKNFKPDLISSHGQTVFHQPKKSTLQLGEASIIKEKTGVGVVSNFRSADIASGGEGAPLVCFFDEKVFKPLGKNFVLQNIGGMANATFVGRNFETFAYDTGIGNAFIDCYCKKFFNENYDKDGLLASKGTVNEAWLEVLMKDEYYFLEPPKSTGREYFSVSYAQNALKTAPESPYDILATITALTAKTIVKSYVDFSGEIAIDEVVLSGGGVKNPEILRYLKQYLREFGMATTKLKKIEDYGINSDFKEALAFAMLGYASFYGIPANVPSCTGANHRTVLGQITL